ncbi:MAG: hypothetical protein WEB52_05300 [Dehalococcoidia bacterium]
MKAWRLIALALVLGMLGAIPAARSDAQEEPVIFISIDANIDNGACRTDGGQPSIDSVTEVASGATYEVGVCISGHQIAPNAIEIRVLYDPEATEVPEIEDQAPALDDNPDANDGDGGTEGVRLGEGWDCSIPPAEVFPKGEDPNTPETDAFIFCLTSFVTPDTDLTASPGLLATLTLRATSDGVETLELGPRTNVFGVNCPTPGQVMCENATIYVGEDVPPEAIATETAAAVAEAETAVAGGSATAVVSGGTETPDSQSTSAAATSVAQRGAATAGASPDGRPTSSGDDAADGEDDSDSESDTDWVVLVLILVGIGAVAVAGVLGYRFWMRRGS